MSILKHIQVTDIFSIKELLAIAVLAPIFVVAAIAETVINIKE